MREAERGPVYQILSRFDDIHRDKKIREKFEVFRHVVFDFTATTTLRSRSMRRAIPTWRRRTCCSRRRIC